MAAPPVIRQSTVHGRGEYLQNLVDLSKELHLNGQITFSANLLPMADLPALSVRLISALSPIAARYSLMEYTELHVPVIAARIPAIEAYFDDDMVQYFPAEDVNVLCDAIIYLYKHRVRLQQLSAGSNRFNEKYAWENIARQYLELVNRLST